MKDFPGNEITPLIIWEPILRTDFARPGTGVLARVADPRAAQFWDPQHLFARELQRKLREDSDHTQPSCCEDNDIPWDMILVYPPGVRWENELPRASFADGPVYRLTAAIRTALSEIRENSSARRP